MLGEVLKFNVLVIESDVSVWVSAWEIAVSRAWSMGQQLYFLFHHVFKGSPFFWIFKKVLE